VAVDLVGDEGIEWIEFSQQHAGAYGIIQNFVSLAHLRRYTAFGCRGQIGS
jgi:hypothetical protein